MNQKTNKKLPAALNTAALKQVKGGFREMPGTINSSLSVRWDEIIIRFQNGKQIKGMSNSGPSTVSSSATDNGMLDVMP
jgi:hypothetical protein